MRELIHINFGSIEAGIWEDELISIHENSVLHHIPLADSLIAGVSILDEHISTFADLSACLGMTPLKGKTAHLLVHSKEMDVKGFAINADFKKRRIPTEDISDLPGPVQTGIINSCVKHGSDVIPVLNTAEFFRAVRDTSFSIAEYKLQDIEFKLDNLPKPENYRYVKINGETYAVPDVNILDILEIPENISPLLLVPDYIRGITLCNDCILPIISMAEIMKIPGPESEKKLFIMEIDGQRIGFSAEQIEGQSGDDIKVIDLPPIAQSGWLKEAIIRGSEIIPLLDPYVLLSDNEDSENASPLSERYHPDSRVEQLFGNQTIEVVEFSLRNFRYSFPKLEAVETIPVKPMRTIPDIKQIVIGVAEHEGELLPVLDLERCFGVSSALTNDWRMILINNGDFKALVVTKEVYGIHSITVDIQRNLPLKLSHNIIYGCYPDSETGQLRLILNAESMAVHFDRASVREFFHQYAEGLNKQELKDHAESPAANGGNIADEAEENVRKPEPQETAEESESPEKMETADIDDTGVEDTGTEDEETGTVPEEDANEITPDQDESGAEESDETDTINIDDENAEKESSENIVEAEDEEVPEDTGPLEQADDAETQAAGQDKPGEEPVPGMMEEVNKEIVKDKAPQEEEGEEKTQPEPEAEKEMQTEEIPEEIERPAAQEADEIAPDQGETIAEESNETDIIDEKSADDESAKSEAAVEKTIVEEKAAQREAGRAEKTIVSGKPEKEETPVPAASGPGGNKLKYLAAAAAFLIAIFFTYLYFSDRTGTVQEESREITETEDPADKTADPGKNEEVIKTREDLPAESRTVKSSELEEKKAEVKISEKTPATIESLTYEVKQGDTLYEITERLTGNGWDYEKIAEENNLENPDLIYPDQKIIFKDRSLKK